MTPSLLTLAPPASARTVTRYPVAFRCEATAQDLGGVREVLLATYRGRSPRLAARWLRAQALHLARLLAPEPEATSLQDAPLVAFASGLPRPDGEFRLWAHSDPAYEHALRALTAGRAIVFSVADYDARYTLRVNPLPTRRVAPAHVPVPRPVPTAPQLTPAAIEDFQDSTLR